ncbi:MAG: hypothetical protein R3F31_21450 [Verrucomicrobiales bacterium]
MSPFVFGGIPRSKRLKGSVSAGIGLNSFMEKGGIGDDAVKGIE